MKNDARTYQIAMLGSFVILGFFVLGFEFSPLQVFLTITAGLGTQLIAEMLWAKKRWSEIEWRSALITTFSLCLLLRSNNPLWWIAGSSIAMLSKFTLRWDGRHIYNPANFALGACLLLSGGEVWIAAGQWGSVAVIAFIVLIAGGFVAHRALRSDVSLYFLAFWCMALGYRMFVLHEPWPIQLNRLENGALLLFTFFMISDPRTTPVARPARIIFAALVAAGAYYIQFKMFRTNGLIWSLLIFSSLVPLMNRIWRAEKFEWEKTVGQLWPGARSQPT
ncbi:MAG TPA: RnfABCDGE type electron transport complex subunit D [Pseudobdellovibrionaceae bacterium]|nr:RnfABCDGE type electron transport complex subunit D [Pseudobdellovibrionaceae bacterium]